MAADSPPASTRCYVLRFTSYSWDSIARFNDLTLHAFRSQQLNLLLVLRQRLAQPLDARTAAFHDVFLQLRVVGHGVIPVVARHAEGVRRQAGGRHHAS